MPKRTSAQIRKDTMEEVKRKDEERRARLRQKAMPNRAQTRSFATLPEDEQNRIRRANMRDVEKITKELTGGCCLDRKDLPSMFPFRQCHGCPRTIELAS